MENLLKIESEKLFLVASKYMDVMCGFKRDSHIAQKSRKKAYDIFTNIFHDTTVDFVIKTIDPGIVCDGYFDFPEERIECDALNKIDLSHVKYGYAFMFHAPMPVMNDYIISDMYLADCWETCLVNAGRDVLRSMLLEECCQKDDKSYFITDTLAPGMSGMPSDSVAKFFNIINAESIGMELTDYGMMLPVKSFVGIYLVLDQEYISSVANCQECMSHHTKCEYCKNYRKLYEA